MAEPTFRVVFRDRWIVVVDKDPGLPSQATKKGERGVYEILRDAHPDVALHHRLDRAASGLLVLALHPDANRGLSDAFARHQAARSYRAVLYGDAAAGTWSWPLDGQPATSFVEPVGAESGFTAVNLRLSTGRTHQLRRHAALAGAPIAGDRRYGGEAAGAWPRLALHAAELTLKHPVHGDERTFRSALPADLTDLWRLASGPA